MTRVPSRPRNRRGASILRRGALVFSLIASIAAGASPASAQTEAEKKESDELFKVGLESMLAGKFEDGCPKLAQSLKLFPRAGTLFTLADCEAQWGHPATAIRHYENYLLMFAQMDRAEQDAQRAKGREKRAIDQRAALGAKVGRVKLTLPPGAPADLTVMRDGEVVESLDAAVAVDPGEHVVTTQVPGGPITEQKFTVGEGETKEVTLEVQAARASDTAAPPTSDGGGMSGLQVGGIIAGGVGVAAIAAGLVMGKVVLDRSAVAEEHCKDQGDGGAFQCDAEGYDAATSGQTLATASTVTFFVGVGALAAGAVMFFIAPSAGSSKSAAKRSPYAFSPVITPLGTSGALVGVSRAW